MKKLISLLFCIGMLSACEQQKKQDDPSTYGTPKTSYGEAVSKAKGLSKNSDLRNEEMDNQAKELESE